MASTTTLPRKRVSERDTVRPSRSGKAKVSGADGSLTPVWWKGSVGSPSPWARALAGRSATSEVAFEDGRFVVKYSDRVLPLDPQTIPAIFEAEEERHQHNGDGDTVASELLSLLEALRQLPENHVTDSERIARRKASRRESSSDA